MLTAHTRDLFINTVILSIIALSLLAVSQIFEAEFALTVFLLIIIWMFDIYLKRVNRINNSTLFADLSFSAFVFFVGRGFDFIFGRASMNSSQEAFQLTMMIVLLFVFWLINLGICGYLERQAATNTAKCACLIFSSIIASASIFIVLIPQFEGAI